MRKVNASDGGDDVAGANADWLKRVNGGKFRAQEMAAHEQLRRIYAKQRRDTVPDASEAAPVPDSAETPVDKE